MSTNTDTRIEDVLREVEALLIRRIEETERENQRLRRRTALALVGVVFALGVAAVTMVAATGGMLANTGASTVTARQFVLRDDAGLVRGVFELAGNNASRLVLRDADGRERMKLTLLADGSPGLTFADRDGRPRTVLGLLPDETNTLVFADRGGQTRAVLGLSPDESSTLVFADVAGETRVALGIESTGAAGVTVFERDGQAQPANDAVNGGTD